jgi:mannan polymerase II complex MNN10 subunit
MKIGIVNYFDANYNDVGAISVPNKEVYAKQHGYDYLLSHETLEPSRPASWNKLRLMQKHISEYDWLWWNDADTLIMNPETKLESLVDPTYPIIVGSDDWGINCGNFFIQNTPQTATILEQWWNKDDEITHPWWEQRALTELMRNNAEWRNRVKVLPEAAMNSHLSHYEEGDFLIHFAGFGNNRNALIDIMNIWA